MSARRASYASREGARAILSVLDSTWPGFAERIARAGALGWHWGEVTTPFLSEQDGEAVAHVGVLRLELLVRGERVPAAGVHAVCCRPSGRGQGHMRAAMEAALAHIDALGLPALLTCEEPAIYERFGFSPVQELRSWFRRPEITASRPGRRLDVDRSADVAALRAGLRKRTAVSERFAVVDPGWLFGLCELLSNKTLRRVRRIEELGVWVVCEVQDRVLELYDVVGPVIPPLEALTPHLPGSFERVRVHFPPDLLGVPDSVEPLPMDDRLMVRGALDLRGGICLPPTARF